MVKVNSEDSRKVIAGISSNNSLNETVNFEENGEFIEMEIDDGGEAARQFASDWSEDENLSEDEMNDDH